MFVYITEYLAIDLDSERWHCRRCWHELYGLKCDRCLLPIMPRQC